MNIGKQKIDAKCNCGRKYSTTFRNVINHKTIRCACGATIQLKDGNNSVRKSVTNINKAVKDFENVLKKLR